MTRLEAMRAAAATKGKPPAARAPAANPAPEAPAKAKAPAKPEAAADEALKYSCGHALHLSHFASGVCPNCVGARRKQRDEDRHRNRERKARERPAGGVPFRLPAGSRKVLQWTGEVWQGELSVPGVPTPFTAEAGGEKSCFHALHDAYVAWLATTKPAGEGRVEGEAA